MRPPLPQLRTANFSGGNQQKIVVGREMGRSPDVLLVGQPTRGVDIGAIEFIHRKLVAMRDAGKAILLVSVELDEIMSLSDRILVMFGGRVVGEVTQAEADERTLGLLMAGGRPEGMEAAGRERLRRADPGAGPGSPTAWSRSSTSGSRSSSPASSSRSSARTRSRR